MYLASLNGRIQLMDADNFKAFHFETSQAALDDLPPSIVADPDGEHVWVSIEWLGAEGVKEGPAWTDQFNAMIEKVRPYGWISQDGLSVRGHIKRP